jgi:hypothetical protein
MGADADRMEASQITISLDLRVTEGSLSGRARGGGATRDFSGWVGLVAAIDALLPPEPRSRSEGRAPAPAAQQQPTGA